MSYSKRSKVLFQKMQSLYKIMKQDTRILETDHLEVDDTFDKVERLESSLLDQLEKVFGADFKNVRLHSGEYASEITAFHEADAVTIGSDIYFADGQYSPHEEEGLSLLVHELQHVVQSQRLTRMMYKEDIEQLEYAAGKAETEPCKAGVHAMAIDSLNDSYNLHPYSGSGGNGALNKTAGESDTMSLGDYSSVSGAQIGVTIQFHDGSTVDLTQKEYAELRRQVKLELLQHLADQQVLLTEEKYEQYVLHFIRYVEKKVV